MKKNAFLLIVIFLVLSFKSNAQLKIIENGNMGVNTDTPKYKLDIRGDSAGYNTRFIGSTDASIMSFLNSEYKKWVTNDENSFGYQGTEFFATYGNGIEGFRLKNDGSFTVNGNGLFNGLGNFNSLKVGENQFLSTTSGYLRLTSANGTVYFDGNTGFGTTEPGNYRINVAGNEYLGGDLVSNGLLSNTRVAITQSDNPVSGNRSLSIGTSISGGYAWIQSWNSQPLWINHEGNPVYFGSIISAPTANYSSVGSTQGTRLLGLDASNNLTTNVTGLAGGLEGNNLTFNYLPKWDQNKLVNSLISDDGTIVNISKVYNPQLRFTETADGNTWDLLTGITARNQFAIRQNSSGTYPFFITANASVLIGGYTSDPTSGNKLAVNGNTYFGGNISALGVINIKGSDGGYLNLNGFANNSCYIGAYNSGNSSRFLSLNGYGGTVGVGYTSDNQPAVSATFLVNGNSYFGGNLTSNGAASFGRVYLATTDNPSTINNILSLGGTSSNGYQWIQSWNSQPLWINKEGNPVYFGSNPTLTSNINGAGITGSELKFFNSYGSGFDMAKIVVGSSSQWYNSYLGFYTNNTGFAGVLTEKMRLSDNGLWIGYTSDPISGNKIAVNGNGYFNGSITAMGGNSSQWNTAYNWGNHALSGYWSPSNHPTTLSGYGISDAQPLENQRLSTNNIPVFAGGNLKGDLLLGKAAYANGNLQFQRGDASYTITIARIADTKTLKISTDAGAGELLLNADGVVMAMGGNSTQWNAAYNHSQSAHSFLPLTGGTVSGNMTVSGGFYGQDINAQATISGSYLNIENSIQTRYGDIHAGGSLSAYTVYYNELVNMSDLNLKTNIADLPYSGDKLLNLRPVKYKYLKSSGTQQNNSALNDNKDHMGFIAQEVQEIFPDLVSQNKDGQLRVNYVELIPVMVQTIKDQNNKIKDLEERIIKIENTIK